MLEVVAMVVVGVLLRMLGTAQLRGQLSAFPPCPDGEVGGLRTSWDDPGSASLGSRR